MISCNSVSPCMAATRTVRDCLWTTSCRISLYRISRKRRTNENGSSHRPTDRLDSSLHAKYGTIRIVLVLGLEEVQNTSKACVAIHYTLHIDPCTHTPYFLILGRVVEVDREKKRKIEEEETTESRQGRRWT